MEANEHARIENEFLEVFACTELNGKFPGYENLKKFLAEGNDTCKEMCFLLAERVRIEEQYARNLQKVNTKVQKLGDTISGTVGIAWKALSHEFSERANMHLTFSNEVKEQCDKQLSDFKSMQKIDHKEKHAAFDKCFNSFVEEKLIVRQREKKIELESLIRTTTKQCLQLEIDRILMLQTILMAYGKSAEDLSTQAKAVSLHCANIFQDIDSSADIATIISKGSKDFPDLKERSLMDVAQSKIYGLFMGVSKKKGRHRKQIRLSPPYSVPKHHAGIVENQIAPQRGGRVVCLVTCPTSLVKVAIFHNQYGFRLHVQVWHESLSCQLPGIALRLRFRFRFRRR